MQVLQELGWRAAYDMFLSGAIAREVRSAYTDPSSPKLRNLRTSAQIAWGLKPGNSMQHRARTRVAHKAQLKLEQGKWQLGQVPVGFEDLVIEARATNQNPSRVYLDGFDESLSVFNIYKQVLRPGAVAIDVGANLGIHSLVMSRCVGEQGHVYSYEPGPDIARVFLENVALNGAGNITLRQHGLGSEPGFMRFK